MTKRRLHILLAIGAGPVYLRQINQMRLLFMAGLEMTLVPNDHLLCSVVIVSPIRLIFLQCQVLQTRSMKQITAPGSYRCTRTNQGPQEQNSSTENLYWFSQASRR